MIEVDLAPGRGKRRRGPDVGSFFRGLSLPSLGRVPTDPWILVPAAVVAVTLGGIGYLYLSVAGVAEDLEVDIEAAAADSARYAEVIERTEGLQARRDTIAERVGLIQELDGERYVWPRLLDEVAQALPDFTWLTEVVELSGGERFRIQGAAGNYFALTSFMEGLESSPFIRNVRLVSTTQVPAEGADDQFVHNFVLEAGKDTAPPDMVRTVPLFPDGRPPEAERLAERGNGSGGGG